MLSMVEMSLTEESEMTSPKIRKVNGQEWTMDGRLVHLRADGVTLSAGGEVVYVMTPTVAQDAIDQYDADRAARSASPARTQARRTVVEGDTYTGRGGRVSVDSPEWAWGRR